MLRADTKVLFDKIEYKNNSFFSNKDIKSLESKTMTWMKMIMIKMMKMMSFAMYERNSGTTGSSHELLALGVGIKTSLTQQNWEIPIFI